MDKNYMVTKSNTLIQAGYDLSTYEQKLILTLASLVQPEDTDFQEYHFRIKDFMNLLGVSNKGQYTDVPKVTKELMKKVFEIRNGNILQQMAWLCSATYRLGEGIVTLKFAPDLKPYMLHLKDFYTTYKLENVLSLKSKYSIRIYELLKCNAYKKTFIIELDELKKIVGANAGYFKTYADFKKTVLLKAQKEINEKTDITFLFKEIKDGRKIKSIEFKITTKQKHQFDNQINVEDIMNSTQSLSDKVNNILGIDFSKNAFENLVSTKGVEKVEFYLMQWDKFNCTNKKNIAGFFYNAVMKDYSIPVQARSYNNKPAQATNYEQREYDDDHYESFYDNFKD